MTLLNYAGIYRTIQDSTGINMGLHRNIPDYTGLYRTILDYTGLHRTI